MARMNKNFYRKLFKSINPYEETRNWNIHAIKRRAYILKGVTKLTKGEEEACEEVYKDIQRIKSFSYDD